MKPGREPASSRPKPCESLTNAPRSLPVRRSLMALVRRKQTLARGQFSPRNLPVRAFDSRTQGFSTPLARERSSFPPPSSNLLLSRLLEHVTVRLRMLLRPTRLSATVPPASRVPPPPEGHQTGARRNGTPGKHHPRTTKPPSRIHLKS